MRARGIAFPLFSPSVSKSWILAYIPLVRTDYCVALIFEELSEFMRAEGGILGESPNGRCDLDGVTGGDVLWLQIG
jgi:hypothetical protein